MHLLIENQHRYKLGPKMQARGRHVNTLGRVRSSSGAKMLEVRFKTDGTAFGAIPSKSTLRMMKAKTLFKALRATCTDIKDGHYASQRVTERIEQALFDGLEISQSRIAGLTFG
jgi:hypothetical protein